MHPLDDIAAMMIDLGRPLRFGVNGTMAIRDVVDLVASAADGAATIGRSTVLHVASRDLLTGAVLDGLTPGSTVSYDDPLDGWTAFQVRDIRRADGDGAITELTVVAS